MFIKIILITPATMPVLQILNAQIQLQHNCRQPARVTKYVLAELALLKVQPALKTFSKDVRETICIGTTLVTIKEVLFSTAQMDAQEIPAKDIISAHLIHMKDAMAIMFTGTTLAELSKT
jgi:hypothetical protein